ncbi:MAG: glycosyltransferase family 4 protein [Legionella sp.]|nr:glycosyltransferase family 4 protein [Legionella sp.]
MSKTIWYCHHYAGSPSLGMSFRPYYMVKEFCNAGHNAYVIAASFHHLKKNQDPQKHSIEKQTIDGVNFITLKTTAYKKNGLLRILNMIQYAFKFFVNSKHIIKHTGKPDVIIVSSAHPFHYLPLARIAKQQGARLIFEVRDLWPLSLIKLLNVPKWHPLVLSLSSIEKRAYTRSDYVVSLLNNALPYMESKGLEQSKFKVISNGISVHQFLTHNVKALLAPELESEIKLLKKKGYFILAYTGAIGKPNALNHLIEAMRILKARDVLVYCFIVGKGALKDELQQVAADLSNIRFISPISESEIPSFQNKMDALYIGWNATDLYKYGISPNKIFYYMMSGKPIVESCIASASFVDRFQCGLQCDPGNPTAIADAIESMSLLQANDLYEMGTKGKAAVINHFDYQVLARRYISLFENKVVVS